MTIYVKSLTQKCATIEVEDNDLIHSINFKAYPNIGLPPDNIAYFYKGKILDPEKIIKDYELQEETVVHMILNIKGG